jgi:acyl-CoA dehydrogenase
MDPYLHAREEFSQWQECLHQSLLADDDTLLHSYQHYFNNDPKFIQRLNHFAHEVSTKLEPLVRLNNQDPNLPTLEQYDALGNRLDEVQHHPSYILAGNIIYGSELMSFLEKPGQMLKTLSLFLLSSHAGEAGHNCPIACSAGIIRVLTNYAQKIPEAHFYIERLLTPSYTSNFTGAQFLTEIQGGSDVGANQVYAFYDKEGHWRIEGEKWFCSNANADLILLTARYDAKIAGSKGLGLFLVPKTLPNGDKNKYTIRRLKQKLGTRSMATAEIDFANTVAYQVGDTHQGIHLVLENVLHLSRLFNAFSVCGLSRRAFQIAYYYAQHRSAFGNAIIDYPLVKQNLASTRASVLAQSASIFHVAFLQDECDLEPSAEKKLLLRTLVNLNKYYTAKYAVENVHHCIDVLAGNGTIESFSSLPRLLRDSIVCENWEGTHYILWMQILKDIHKFEVDKLFLRHIDSLITQCKEDELRTFALQALSELVTQCRIIKEQDEALQTLEIQDVVEKMGALLAYVCLLREISHKQNATKAAAASLFAMHFLNKEQAIDANYLQLIEAVLSEG